MKLSQKFQRFLAFSEFFLHFFSKSRDNLSFPSRFYEIPAKCFSFFLLFLLSFFLFFFFFFSFFSRASDERSYQKKGKGRAVWVRRTRKAISRKCKMLSSYSTYPTQWIKKFIVKWNSSSKLCENFRRFPASTVLFLSLSSRSSNPLSFREMPTKIHWALDEKSSF